MGKLLRTTLFLLLIITSQAAMAACDQASASNIRSSSMDDTGKRSTLRALGCDTSDLDKRIDVDYRAGLELNRKINEEKDAKEKAERAEKDRKSEAEFNASLAEDTAERDAFAQEMADKCGEYPLPVEIGMSEKILKIGCAGQADLVGKDKNASVYRMYGLLVSVYKGKVVRWVRE